MEKAEQEERVRQGRKQTHKGMKKEVMLTPSVGQSVDIPQATRAGFFAIGSEEEGCESLEVSVFAEPFPELISVESYAGELWTFPRLVRRLDSVGLLFLLWPCVGFL